MTVVKSTLTLSLVMSKRSQGTVLLVSDHGGASGGALYPKTVAALPNVYNSGESAPHRIPGERVL